MHSTKLLRATWNCLIRKCSTKMCTSNSWSTKTAALRILLQKLQKLCGGLHSNSYIISGRKWTAKECISKERSQKIIPPYIIRGGQKHKSQKPDGCPINSHFIGLGLLRTVFEIVVACQEGPVPEFCCIAGEIERGISENIFRPITFDCSVLRT